MVNTNLSALEQLTHYEHSQKVSQISGLLARHCGFPEDEASIIQQAALYHDVGKRIYPNPFCSNPRGSLRLSSPSSRATPSLVTS